MYVYEQYYADRVMKLPHGERGSKSLHKLLTEDSKLEVGVLVTDRHKQINKWLQDVHPKITHYYNIWHVAKGMYVCMYVYNNYICTNII